MNTIKQAIMTKYIAPTNCTGARVKATCSAGSMTAAWDYNCDDEQNHWDIAHSLASKYMWTLHNHMFMGSCSLGGYVFVLVSKDDIEEAHKRMCK